MYGVFICIFFVLIFQQMNDEGGVKCYNCEGIGHFAKKCASNRGVLNFSTDPVECRQCKVWIGMV